MSEPNAPEPTMEEILASIRRIISEDEPPPSAAEPAEEPEPEIIMPGAPPPVVAEHEDVLELTEPVHEQSSPFETIGDLDILPAHHAAAPEPVAHAPLPLPPMNFESPFDDEPLVGDSAADSAASAFGHLAHHLLMPGEGRTLEDVVREMLRPLLKTWLDTHLPGIVQAKVDEEVARISRRRI